MADHHHHDDASISINGRSRGSSKAQLSLQKILQTISSTYQIQAPPIPHHQSPASASSSSSSTTTSSSSVLINVSDEMMGPAVNLERNNVGSSLHFDLNLSPPPEEEEEQIDFSDQTHHKESQFPVVNASDGEGVQENDNERILEVDPEEEDGTDYSDQTLHRESQFPVGYAGDGGAIQEDNNERLLEVGPEEQKQDEEEDKNKRQRRLAALLDAVRIVSGHDGPSEPMDPAELLSPVDNRSTATSAATDHELARNPRLHLECEEEEKVQKNAAAEDEAVEEEPVAKEKVLAAVTETAVVRTKRGRAQVLPNKYRDSFVEPITNLSSRHNRSSSSSSSKHVPSKRRSTR